MSELLAKDAGEVYKGGIHLALFGLATVCAAYNGGAWSVRPEKRLLINAAVYVALAVREAGKVREHWRRA